MLSIISKSFVLILDDKGLEKPVLHCLPPISPILQKSLYPHQNQALSPFEIFTMKCFAQKSFLNYPTLEVLQA